MEVKRIIFVLSILLTYAITTLAQTVRLQVPEVCEVGQRINVRYIVDTQDVHDIQVGEFPGFEYLYGPSTSSQSSYQMINGKTTHSSSMTFTYTLLALEEGEHKMPAATVKLKDKTIKSGTATIQVLPATNRGSSSSNSNGVTSGSPSANRPSTSQSGASVTSKDLFITATASKTKIFEQEAILLTYKLYTLVNIRQLAGDMPELDGFHCQELDSKAQLSLKYENYNGRNYGTAIWRQYVLFPQKSGKLTIPSINFDAEIETTNPNADPFDIFFGGGSLTQLYRKTIKTPQLEINVKPLPTPSPSNFSGCVGKFTLKASLSPQQLNANDAATLNLSVSGQGNMKLMKAPVIDVPKDFEIYTPKETDKTTITSAGSKGNIIFDYVIVPRHGGAYSISPVEFVYFNPETEKYVTLKTDSFHLDVAKAKHVQGTPVPEKEDLRVLSSDIHYIKGGHIQVRNKVDDFFLSTSYFLIYLALIVIFLLMLFIFQRQAKANADIVRKRGKRAGKAATKRLKQAKKLLKNHEVAPFYEEVQRALLGYASDKLNIPMTDLTKENVSGMLSAKYVAQSVIQQYIDVLESCEYARFAPGDPFENMDKVFESASNAINNLDKNL